MSLLQYTSNEMFSSTELVRKNKNIFDKLNKKEIEKAVILRDGKPSIILMDFQEYERIIADYLKSKGKEPIVKEAVKVEPKKEEMTIKEEKIVSEEKKAEKLDDKDLEAALAEIEKLDFRFDAQASKAKEEPLKEFWD